MGFLKKIRNNILNQQNSFHVGFGNRSPFSYRGKYSGDWTPEVPNLETSAYGQPETDLGETKLLKAQMGTISAVSDAVTDIAKAYIKKEAKENCTGTWDAANEKCQPGDSSKNSESKNKLQADYNVKKEFRKVGENVEEITNPTEPTTTEIKEDFDKQMCWSNGGVWQSKQGVPGGKCSK